MLMINKQLQMLWRLQILEQNKIELQTKKNTLNLQALKAVWRDMLVLKSNIEQQEYNLVKCKEKSAELEETLKFLANQLQTLESKLYESYSKNIKEIVLLKEKYEHLKALIVSQEDELLEFLDQGDKLTAEITRLKSQLALKKQEYKEMQCVLTSEIAVIDKFLENIQVDIETCRKQVDKEILVIYQELKRTMGNPIAKLKNEFCTGCYRSLPMTKIAEARSKIVYCDNCGRFLLSDGIC